MINKILPDQPAFLTNSIGKFGVPLYCPYIAFFGHIDRLNQSVLGICHWIKQRRQLFDCLMMIAIDLQTIGIQQSIQRGILDDTDRVYRFVIWRRLTVNDRGRLLRRQVLIQCPAKKRVDELDFLTNTKGYMKWKIKCNGLL